MLSARRVGGSREIAARAGRSYVVGFGRVCANAGIVSAEGDTPRETLTCRSPATCNGDAAIAAVTFSLR